VTGLTEQQRRALTIITEHRRPIRPSEFAQKMWPDSPAWARYTNVGNGTAQGVGIVRSGGAYLGRLAKMGLLSWTHDNGSAYRLTRAGRAALTGEQP
jgi:hypothetical protein